MVPKTGIEPVRPYEREILSLLCLPISPLGQSQQQNLLYTNYRVCQPCCFFTTLGALSQIRTETARLLRPLPLPIGIRGQILVDADGFEPPAFLMSQIYSLLPSTVWLRIQNLAEAVRFELTVEFLLR